MNRLLKPVWVEGTLVSQQHLQQSEVYWSALLNMRLKASAVYPNWGWLDFEIDALDLQSAILTLKHYKAIFPSGRVVFGETLFLNLEQWTQDLEVFIELPCDAEAAVSGISGYQNAEAPSHVCEYKEVADLYDPSRTAELLIGRLVPSLSVHIDQTSAGDNKASEKLFLCRLRHVGGREFMVIEEQLPPFLNVLNQTEITRKMVQIKKEMAFLLGKKEVLLHQTEHRFLVNKMNLFEHKLQAILTEGAHPKELYNVSLEFYFEILDSTLGEDQPSGIPHYQHGRPGACSWILQQISSTLSKWFEKGLKTHRFENRKINLLASDLDGQLVLKIVNPGDLTFDWQTLFIKEVKVASPSDLENIVASALPGLELLPLAKTKYKLSSIEHCFLILRQGSYWTNVVKNLQLAIFYPNHLNNLEVELIIIDQK